MCDTMGIGAETGYRRVGELFYSGNALRRKVPYVFAFKSDIGKDKYISFKKYYGKTTGFEELLKLLQEGIKLFR